MSDIYDSIPYYEAANHSFILCPDNSAFYRGRNDWWFNFPYMSIDSTSDTRFKIPVRVEFADPHEIDIVFDCYWWKEGVTVADVHTATVDAMKEILAVIESGTLKMRECVKLIAFFTIMGCYHLWRFRSWRRQLANRTSKFKIGFTTVLEAVIVLIASTLFWKLSIGFPWSMALFFALIMEAGIGLITLSTHLIYSRDKA